MKHPIVDLRSPEQFTQNHIKGSANIPAPSIEERMHELPNKSSPLNLVGNIEELDMASAFLKQKGYLVNKVINSESLNFENKEFNPFTSTGTAVNRLWQPASVVKKFAELVKPTSSHYKGIDLACGSGRDCVYLTQQGWNMTAIDYSSVALEKLSLLASVNQREVNSINLDIEKNFSKLESSFENAFDLVVTVRYLHRPILERLTNLIKVKGYIVYQTFLRGSEKFGSPKNPNYLLEEGELAKCFAGFEILLDDIKYLDDGRPTNRFIARRIN